MLVGSCAALLDGGAERGGVEFADYCVAEVDSCGGFGPGLQVGDPGMVFEDFAFFVEAPEGDLGGEKGKQKVNYMSMMIDDG